MFGAAEKDGLGLLPLRRKSSSAVNARKNREKRCRFLNREDATTESLRRSKERRKKHHDRPGFCSRDTDGSGRRNLSQKSKKKKDLLARRPEKKDSTRICYAAKWLFLGPERKKQTGKKEYMTSCANLLHGAKRGKEAHRAGSITY